MSETNASTAQLQDIVSDIIQLFNQTLGGNSSLVTAASVTFYVFVTLGFCANLFLGAIIFFNRKYLLKQPVTILVLNLAMADTCFLLTNLILNNIQSSEDNLSAEIKLIKAALATFWVEADALLSDLTVAAVAVFNFITVLWPIKSRVWLTRKRAVYLVVATWSCCLITSLPIGISLFRDTHLSFLSSRTKQNLELNLTEQDLAYLFAVDFVRIALPTVVIATLYPAMIRTLWRQMKAMPGQKLKQEAIKHLVFVCVVLFCNVGMHAAFDFSFYFIVYNQCHTEEGLSGWTMNWAAYYIVMIYPTAFFHTILNPVVHALSTKNFKRYYVPLWCQRKSADHFKTTIRIDTQV